MKKIILLGAILFLGPAGWGDMDAGTTPTADGTSQPPVHHKKKAKKAVPAVTAASAVKAATAALDPVLPVPARTVLDEVVLETNALSPLTPTLSPQEGRGRNSATGEGSSPPTLRAWIAGQLIQTSPLDVSLSGGIQTFRSVASPAVALRIKRPGSPWSGEIGAATPRYPGGSFQQETETFDGTTYNPHVRSFYEVHLTADYEWRLIKRGTNTEEHGTWYDKTAGSRTTYHAPWEESLVSLTAGFGVSMLSVSNQIDTSTPYTWTFAGTTYSYQLDRGYAVTNTSFSPLFRLGVTLFPDRLVSLRSDVAYVGYANTASAAGQAFDLGFSGVMFREMLQVRL